MLGRANGPAATSIGVGDADAAQLAALLRLLAPRREVLVAGELGGLLHALDEIAAIVGEDERRLVGHRLGRNQVALAQLERIDVHLLRGDVDQPLDRVGRIGPAGAAIRRGRRGVREDAGGLPRIFGVR